MSVNGLRRAHGWACCAVCVAVLVLTGCATERAFREGGALAKRGQFEQALTQFERASQADRGSAKYRMAVLQTREALVAEALSAGQQALAERRWSLARAAFERALTWQPGNQRAIEGLAAVQAQEQPKVALAQIPGVAPATDQLTNQLAQAYRKPISIEFKDVPIKTVFEVISRTSGLNFMFDRDVRTDQKTSLFLRGSTIEAAVQMTLLTNQLEQRVLDANTVLIYPNTSAKQKDYQALTVKAFYLSHAEAKTVANTLKALLKSRDVVVDDKLNLLILRDTPQAVEMASRLVAMHDVGEPEVMLEVEILEVKRTRLLDLGIRWPDQVSLSPLAASTGALTLADLRGLNSETLAANIGAATINAAKVDSDTNLLANPRIRVRNREKAKILIGERVPNITSTSTATGFVAESVSYVDVGLKLDVEPTVSVDGEVAIKVALEVSSVTNQLQTKSGSVAYQIGTRTAQTVLRLKDGENQVLAGLINSEDRRSGNKVPGLGDVPVLGRLFGEQRDDASKTEIVLSITPRVLRHLVRPAPEQLVFDTGTESSLGALSWERTTAGKPSVVSALTEGVEPGASPSVQQAPTQQTPTQQAPQPSPSAPGLDAAAQLSWQAPSDVKVGDLFSVRLNLQSTQALSGLPLSLSFDARSLQVISVTEGDFFSQGPTSTQFSSRIDPSGQVVLMVARSDDRGADGQAAVATLNMRLVAPYGSQPQLEVKSVTATGPGGKAVRVVPPSPLRVGVKP